MLYIQPQIQVVQFVSLSLLLMFGLNRLEKNMQASRSFVSNNDDKISNELWVMMSYAVS